MVDDTDKKILTALRKDSDRARNLIAKEAGLSEPNLSKRVKLLQHDKILKKFTVALDFDKLGFDTHSVTLIKMKEQGQDDALIRKLTTINEAIEIYSLLGEWDLFVRWNGQNPAEVMGRINEIQKDPAIAGTIERTETLQLGQCLKRESGPSL